MQNPENPARSRRTPAIMLTIVIVALLAAGALWYFKPWAAVVDTRVDEALPGQSASAAEGAASQDAEEGASAGTSEDEGAAPDAPVVVAEGQLVDHAYATSGTVRIYRLPDGAHQLALEDLDTQNGPDVHVWLSENDVSAPDHDHQGAGSHPHLDLGLIKGNQGNQVYALPDDFNPSAWKSVDLWCDRFSESFGAAPLNQA